MLRVTEEKERNFEKRGYMGKKVLGVLTILLILTGCQNMGNEAENLQQVEKQENGEERNSSISNDETETNVTHEKDQELSNGEHIRFQLGSQAKIDAVVDMPGQMRWYQLHGGSIRNFKDFFVIAGYFLILTGMEGVIFVRVVKRREQNG